MRYTGSDWKRSRRLGFSTLGTGKELAKRPYGPGQHGNTRKKKPSEYGKQLVEKQKLRQMYKHLLFKTAKEQVMHSLRYAYNDRRKLKSDYRKLWIRRINAACRMNDISYSRFMFGLKQANVQVNRKMLSELAINDPSAFADLVKLAKENAK